jgi:mitochondrial translocator assembly and maintenance protein 41
MNLVENPYKVQNIVNAQMDIFREKYFQIINDLENVAVMGQGNLEQDMNIKTRGRIIQSLPTNFRAIVKHIYLWELSRDGNFNVSREDSDLMQQLSEHPRLNTIISKGTGH